MKPPHSSGDRVAWCLLGALLIGVAHMRWGIALIAWVAPVPLLHVLRQGEGWAARWCVVGALFVGYTLAILKITTPPIPAAFAPMFALPPALLQGAGYLLWDLVCRRARSEWVRVLGFPALLVLAEYAQHRFTSFGSWGAAAYTQVEFLPLLQVASLFGLAGVSFLLYFLAAALEARVRSGRKAQGPLAVALGLVCAALGFGTLRLDLSRTGPTARVAAVGTDATASGWPLQSEAERHRIDDGLLARTDAAARAGARLVAWPEAATVVLPAEEPSFLQRLSQAARSNSIELVAAYIVPWTDQRRYQNKYAWLRPDGSLDHTYLKHQPVPSEPAERGRSVPKAVETALGKATGAICYDYDFPQLAREHAALGINLAVLPSSDWRGIDPIHTQMASLRAIEGGFSLLRSTRFGLSAGFDPYGRARAWQSSFDTGNLVLLVELPLRRVTTLYSQIGDSFVLLCAAFSAVALFTTAPVSPAAGPAPRSRVPTP